MTRITYIPNRVIDTNGISDGASIYVYETGGTTPVSLFSDSGLTVPLANPYVVAAGAAVPPLYTDHTGNIRVRVVASDGTVQQDDDPYERLASATDLASSDAAKGAALIDATRSDVTSPTIRTQRDKNERDQIPLLDFCSGVEAQDASPGFARAIAKVREYKADLLIPAGDYRLTDTATLSLDDVWQGRNIRGMGAGSKFIWDGGDDKPVLHLRGEASGGAGLGWDNQVTFRDFSIVADAFTGGTQNNVVAIQIGDTPEDATTGVCNVALLGLNIRQVTTGILGYYESDEVLISRLLLEQFTSYGIHNSFGGSNWWMDKIHLTDGGSSSTGIRTSLDNSVINDFAIQGSAMLVGIQVDGGATLQGRNARITNGYIESQTPGASGYGIILYGVDTAVIENINFKGWRLAKLIVGVDASDATPCKNINIGPNRHSVSGGEVEALVDFASTSENCTILGKQETNGSTLTITGPFTTTIMDGVVSVGSGVKFPATQVPSSNVNTLDDYEEQDISCGIRVGATAQTTVSAVRVTKIGRLVTASGYVAMGAAVSGAGDLYITGLPYAAAAFGTATISASNVSFSGAPGGFISSAATEIALTQTADAGTRSALTNTNLASNSEIEFSITYMAAT